MLKSLLALLSGVIFGLGLIIAGMANPAKVLAFLDVTGAWDPSLALVMVGAIAVAAPAFMWARRRQRSLLGEPLQIPAAGRLDRRLLAGSVLFGIGWGIAGICPGPAWVLAGAEISRVWPFLLAMLAGMALYDVYHEEEEEDMSIAKAVLRIARPTDRLQEIATLYCRGLGFEKLGEFVDHQGFDGMMIGHPQHAYHLEFTQHRGVRVGQAPTQDHLLVFYLPDENEWRAACERMREAGFLSVAAYNPYWDRAGQTFEDPDGYRVVLQHQAWQA